MKIQTNQGDVELTAEMVCRGMVFTAADYHLGGGLFVVGRRDDANNVWRDAGDDGLGTNLLGARRFLGCDPTVASRADCERFGVHGDAAAHGFARLRDGGAVDLYRVPLAGLVTEDGVGQRRAFEDPATCFADEHFLGLDSRHASPEDVRRLCCGAEEAETIVTLRGFAGVSPTGRVCSLAIGDHDMHEDLATGAKWSARKVQFYDRVDIHLDGKPLREDLYPRRLAALADGISGDAGGLYVPALPIPTCGCCGKATEPSRIGPTMLVLPVGDCLTAEAPICRSCLVDVNEDIAAWTIRDGKIERKVRAACPNCGGDDATCRGSLAGLKACAAKGAQWGVADIVSGKALDGLALLYDEKRRAGETCEDLRARLRGLRSRKDTGNGFRVGGSYVRVGVDHAQSGTEATAFVSAAMRKAGESLARVGEAARWAAASSIPVLAKMPAPKGGWRTAEQIDREVAERGRRNREAPLVALVAAVPEGLDPIGWRAAVLAVHEHHGRFADRLRGDLFAEWLVTVLREGLTAVEIDGYHGLGYLEGLDSYQRAIAPAPKVDRVRATWKTRGPVLPCDNGWDE